MKSIIDNICKEEKTINDYIENLDSLSILMNEARIKKEAIERKFKLAMIANHEEAYLTVNWELVRIMSDKYTIEL